MACTNWRVKRAKAATEPEMSARTRISGFDGWGRRKRGSTGTPPYDSDWRTVRRMSRRPRRWWRRLRARRAAMRRARGCRVRRSAARSSGLAWRKSTSAGSGRRSAPATTSGPCSATSRRRTSASISARSRSRRARSSSRSRRWSRPAADAPGQQPLQRPLGVELAQGAEDVERPPHRPARVHPPETGDGLAGQLPQQLVVARLQRRLQQRGQLARGQGVVGGEDRQAQGEPHVEDGVEGGPVLVALDQGGGQRPPQRLPVVEGDVGHRLHRVEVLGGRHGQARPAQLPDEAGQRVEHFAARRRPPPAARGRPWRCRPGA